MGKEVRKEHPAIVCRCNDVTVEDVERAIEEGCRDIECLRKVLRVGMGPCQGRTCIPILARILARKLGKKVSEIEIPVVRAPIIPLPAHLALKSIDADEGGND
ncbi:MAG: (2Fe-2S)-binding protein [Crenarchaeota archaeon]|nr:(2Fe-2S)-binding protein [Thermoproteota archaeon]